MDILKARKQAAAKKDGSSAKPADGKGAGKSGAEKLSGPKKPPATAKARAGSKPSADDTGAFKAEKKAEKAEEKTKKRKAGKKKAKAEPSKNVAPPQKTVPVEESLPVMPVMEEEAPPLKNTPVTEIPAGALAPEEMELSADDFNALPGTMDMPELPDLSDDELSGTVALGDIQEQPGDSGPGETRETETSDHAARRDDMEETPEPEPAIKAIETEREPYEDEMVVDAGEPPSALYSDGEEFDENEYDERLPDEMPMEFLSFMVGMEEYGLPLNRISEIIKPRAITEVPHTPGFVLGILILRGMVIPIFDLAKKLVLGNVNISKTSRIIIVNRDENKVGLMVDKVREVVKVLPRDIEPPPPVIAGVDMQFLDGVGRYEQGDSYRKIAKEEEEKIIENDGKVEKGGKINNKRRLVILLNLTRVATL